MSFKLHPARRLDAGALPWLALGVVWIVWGSTYLGIRVAVQSIPPYLMAGSRFTLAGAVLFALIWVAQGRPRVRLGWEEVRSVLIAAVALLVVGNGLLCFSEVHLESGTAALLVSTVPVWMIVIDAILARRVEPLALIGVLLGTVGIAVLAGSPSLHGSLVILALVLFGSFSWAAGSVYARRYGAHHLNPLLPALEMFVAGILLTAIGMALGEFRNLHPAQIPPAAFYGWLWLVVAGAMIGYTAYGYVVRTLPTSAVATYAYVNPIVAVLLGAGLLKERLTWSMLAGGCAIVVSVFAIVLSNRKAAPQGECTTETEIGEAA